MTRYAWHRRIHSIAEHFRDTEHGDVLLLIDNIFRFVQAGMETSALVGRISKMPGTQDFSTMAR